MGPGHPQGTDVPRPDLRRHRPRYRRPQRSRTHDIVRPRWPEHRPQVETDVLNRDRVHLLIRLPLTERVIVKVEANRYSITHATESPNPYDDPTG
ncbi:phage tail protein [Cupriavidus agavae]|uniref:phage tail protein n=1 Tax=Cupriavidus agavae TaxID=1001822 RepID=UPI0022A70DEC|nr:phage tail protein [Cupriavidus agavae]